MRLLLLLCLVAVGAQGSGFWSTGIGAPLLASAQLYCMTGIPCGDGCTMGDGRCINGRCFDRDGRIEWECMAPMRAPGTPFRLQGRDSQPAWLPNPTQAPQNPDWMPRFPTWQPWGFPSMPTFTFWKPWAPYTPFAPMPMFNNDCGGKGPCAKGEFCDAQGVCRVDDCASQFKYGCPDDKGELKKIACPHFSGFKECYTSTSDGFRCFKGPSGSSLACASQSSTMGGGSVWSSSSGFSMPSFDVFDDIDDDSMVVDEAPVEPKPAVARADAVATAKPDAAPATPKPDATPATAKPAAAKASAAAAATDSSSQQSAFKKVATEAGPAQAASATAAGAATSAQKKQLAAAASPIFIMQSADAANQGNMPPMSRIGPIFNSDGSTLMAAGPGPSIGMVDVDPNGNGMAAGMASGDQKTVVTQRGPNGMSSRSSSVSNNGNPAIASSVASSGPTTTPMQVPEEWDVPTSTPAATASSQPTAPGAQVLPQQQPTAASSRDGTSRDAGAGADSAKATGVKSSAGRGLRGGMWLWQSVAAGSILLLLL